MATLHNDKLIIKELM